MTRTLHDDGRIFDCAGKSLDLNSPVVMGILNVTEDSFYDGGSYTTPDRQVRHVEKMLGEGASVIDVGAVSTRPGSKPVTAEEEKRRLIAVLENLEAHFPEAIFSVDTFRADVASEAYNAGAGMINDIYGGTFDPDMIPFVVSRNLPYILMHMQGDPENMQSSPEYENVIEDIHHFFGRQLIKFPEHYNQVVLDPGFGFGKTLEHNFQLLSGLDNFLDLGYPLLAGLSRKSMINKALHITPDKALNGTSVLNTIALLNGASVLRVHDVREAIEAVRLVSMLKG